MGAEAFSSTSTGKTAKEAFWKAVDAAQRKYGYEGYTGSIAEKDEFVMIKAPKDLDPYEYTEKLSEEHDDRISDKWGPAGCIEVKKGTYYFFGSASC